MRDTLEYIAMAYIVMAHARSTPGVMWLWSVCEGRFAGHYSRGLYSYGPVWLHQNRRKHRIFACANYSGEYIGPQLCIGSVSASPMACPLRNYGRADTQNGRAGTRNDRLGRRSF